MKVPLSVVILTKNEEANIRECLESVYGWADEIIVVDDESTDRTREIASPYADKVIVKRMDVEGRHRNWAYGQARNLWVLSLDADERLTEELKQEIREVLKEPGDYVGFTIPRKNFIGNYWVRFGGWYPSAQLKLFRKDRFKWEEVQVHPRAFLEGKCGHLKSDLIHYSYKDIADFLQKLNHQTTLEAQKWVMQGKEMKTLRFIWRMVDRFLRSYIRKKGYKDGFYGFVVASFSALYQFISLLKYKEMMRKGG